MKKFFDAVSKVFKTDPNRVGEDGLTRLQRAIINDDEARVRKLIEMGADVNDRGNLNYQPLHLALTRDRGIIAQLLIEASADIETKDDFGRTPLHIAASMGQEFILLRLLKLGADPNARNKKGQTPLHLMSSSKPDVISYMRAFKADLNATDDNGDTPLHLMMKHKHMIDALLQMGADPNISNHKRLTPFMIALNDEEIAKDHRQMMRMINSGAKIETRDQNGETAIFCAIRTGNAMLFDYLVTRCDLSVKTLSGSNLLHVALLNGAQSFSTALILAKPELLHEQNNAGKTPLLAYMDAVQTRSYLYSTEKFETMVKKLITAGADINTRDCNGRTLVHYAVRNHCETLLDFLIDQGANLDIRDNDDKAAIHYVIERKNMPLLDTLLDAKANPDQTDTRGWTILDRLAEKSDRDSPIVQRLIVAGGQYEKQLPLRPEQMRPKDKEAPRLPQSPFTGTSIFKRADKPAENAPQEASKKKPPKKGGPKL